MVGKIKKKGKLKGKDRKKKWFVVKAPEIFNNIEIGEIAGFEPDDLLGRTIIMSFRDLLPESKDSNQKIVLRVIKVRGETALTKAEKFFVSESYIQRVSRRSKEKIISIQIIETKDKKKLKYKVYTLLDKRVVRAIRTALGKKVKTLVKDYASKKLADSLFTPNIIKGLSGFLKKELKSIYPAHVIIWKISKVD